MIYAITLIGSLFAGILGVYIYGSYRINQTKKED